MTPRWQCVPLDDPSAPTLCARPGARVLHFFRHGESLHQVRNEDARRVGRQCRCFDGPVPTDCPYWSDDLIDAPLTDRGRAETANKAASLDVDVVLASPMTRTLESALLAFPQRVPVIAMPELRPRVGPHRHSRRGLRSQLVARFPTIDLSRITDEEDTAWQPVDEPRSALEARAERFLDFVFTHAPARIGIVTHFTSLLAMILPADDTFTIGPTSRPAGSPALLDASLAADPLVLREPVAIGETRSMVAIPA